LPVRVLVYLTSHYWYLRAKEYVMQFLKVTAGIAQPVEWLGYERDDSGIVV
jgi:hypothetical protein